MESFSDSPAADWTIDAADAVNLATRHPTAPLDAASLELAKVAPTPGNAPAAPILGDARMRRGVGGRDGCGVFGADIEDDLRRTSMTSCDAWRDVHAK